MQLSNTRFGGLLKAVFLAAIWSGLATPLWAASGIIEPTADYYADDIHTSIVAKGHDVSGNLLAVYDENAGLQVFDRAASEHYNIGASGVSGDSWVSFVTFNPGGNSIWVGYDYNIYEVTDILGTPTWNHRATLWYNFDLAFSGDTPYVSGLNTESYGPNSIWRLDTSGNNNHALVAATGGFSAGIDFDSQGNLYYATNLGADEKLVRFSAGQVATGNLTLIDAQTLADIPFSAYDTVVDDAGNVVFDFSEGGFYNNSWTQLNSTLAVWNGVAGSGENYDVIGTAGVHHWFTYLSSEGIAVGGDGSLYLADGGYYVSHPGLAEIRPVPEPSTFALLIAGLLAVFALRRRK